MKTILAIDDIDDNLLAMTALLKNFIPGCSVITARSGYEGIEKAESDIPDVILLDIKMPDMDGYETCRHLKSNNKIRHIPVIMITAMKTDTESRIKGLEIGADAFISKPVEGPELAAQVNAMLRIKTAEDMLRDEKGLLESLIMERTKALRKSETELRDLSSHLQDVREEERTQIAREIHDELGQSLTVLKMDIAWLKKKLKDDQNDLKDKASSITGLIDSIIDSVRRISADLRPGVLDDLGICAAVKRHAKEIEKSSEIKCLVSCIPENIFIRKEHATAVYRIFQEVMTNVIRHSEATRVDINLRERNDNVELEIKDNGKGISQEEINNPKSFGIMGIRERVHSCNGTFIIKGKRNEGTYINVKIPLMP